MTCSRYTAVTVNGRKRSKQIIRKKERERAMRRENSLEVQDISVIRSGRNTVSLQIDKDLKVTVRAPYRMSDAAVRKFIEEKSDWIEKHIRKMQERREEYEAEPGELLTVEELRELARKAAEYIPGRVACYAPLIGVSYGRITIRNQRSRWGSCSSRGNLNFNCLLMLAPPEIIDYVIVHELCHRREMNHSPLFWQEVERVLPDYKRRRKWLKDNGERIMRRMLAD